MFTVKGYDSFSNEGFTIGEYETKRVAIYAADKHSSSMTITYVYDEKGRVIHKAGTY